MLSFVSSETYTQLNQSCGENVSFLQITEVTPKISVMDIFINTSIKYAPKNPIMKYITKSVCELLSNSVWTE
jgi:hypothetical protein